MSDKLIITKRKTYHQNISRVIRVSGDIYDQLTQLSSETKTDRSVLASDMINFAIDHLEIVEGEE